MSVMGLIGFVRSNRARVCALALLAALGGCATPEAGAALDDTRVQRLARMFQTALPIAEVVASVAQGNPNWPLQDRARATPDQIRCMRGELSPERFRERQAADALAYALAHRHRLDADLAVLEGGAAQAIHDAFMARSESALKPLDPEQEKNVIALLRHADFQALREAMQIDGMAAATLAGPEARTRQARQAGLQIADSMMFEPVLAALERCEVPLIE